MSNIDLVLEIVEYISANKHLLHEKPENDLMRLSNLISIIRLTLEYYISQDKKFEKFADYGDPDASNPQD